MAFVFVSCSNELTDSQHVDNAERYIEAGELNTASISLKNALRDNPNNPKARWLLGKLYFEIGNFAGAEKELRRARELGVAEESVFPILMQVLLEQGNYDEIASLTSVTLKDKQSQSIVLAVKGLAKLALNDLNGATLLIDNALSVFNKSTFALVAKSHLLVVRKENQLARENLNNVFVIAPDYAPAYSLLGDIEVLENHPKEAEEAYTKAIGQRYNNSVDLLKRAQVLVQLEDFTEAQKDIDILKKRLPKDAAVNYVQGLIYFNSDNLTAAQEAFESALAANNRYLLAAYYLAVTHLRLGNLSQAENYASSFYSQASNSLAGRMLMAQIHFRNRKFENVVELIAPVVEYQTDNVIATELLANALYLLGKTDKATQLLKKLIQLQPESAIAHVRLGRALFQKGEMDSGLKSLETAIQLSPNFSPAHIQLVKYFLSQKQYSAALQQAKRFRDLNPGKAIAFYILGSVYLASGEREAAAEAFRQALSIEPGDPNASHALATLAIEKKDYESAHIYYNGVLNHHKNHLDTLLLISELYALEGNVDALGENLAKAVVAHPGSLPPKILLSRYYLATGKVENVATLLSELTPEDRKNSAVLEITGLAHLAQKKYHDAQLAFNQLTADRPDMARAHYLLAQAYGGMNDPEKVQQELEKTVELAPLHFSARIALARLLLSRGNVDGAKEQMKSLPNEHPDVMRLQARLMRLGGNESGAAMLMREIFDTSPSTPDMLFIANQEWEKGNIENALEMQVQWSTEHPDDDIAALALADAYTRINQNQKAIITYKRILEKDSTNLFALNQLAWYLRNVDPKEALPYAQRASIIAPKSAVILDTLAMVLLANEDVALAKRTIERALVQNPRNSTLLYHSALIDNAFGQKTLAKETLINILAEKNDFPEKASVEELLKKIESGE